MKALLQKFFEATEGSIKGYLNPEDLFRSLITSLASGTTIGISLIVLQAVQTNVSAIFPNPTVASLATALISLVIDLLRRQNQGNTATPLPTPAVTPASPSA